MLFSFILYNMQTLILYLVTEIYNFDDNTTNILNTLEQSFELLKTEMLSNNVMVLLQYGQRRQGFRMQSMWRQSFRKTLWCAQL